MKVGFDVTWMHAENAGQGGGVFQYSFNLIISLVKLTDIQIVAIISPTGVGIFEHLKIHSNFSVVVFHEAESFSEMIRLQNIDVIHTPLQYNLHLTLAAPMITTLHDLQHFHLPEFFNEHEIHFRNIHYKKSSQFNERVIVSFSHVKNDIVRFYDIDPDKIDVCGIGIEPPEQDELPDFSEIKQNYNLPESYIIYSANTWRHKNHVGLIKALKILHEKYDMKISLVCTGHRNNFYQEIESLIESLCLDNYVFFIGYVPTNELHVLLRNASLAVIPTLYEAGSFPLFEAMAYSVPVICSNVTSLPETIGDAKFTFDPQKTDEMADKIATMLKDNSLILENINNSRKMIKNYDWAQKVKYFIESYSKAIINFDNKFKYYNLLNLSSNFEYFINFNVSSLREQLKMSEDARTSMIDTCSLLENRLTLLEGKLNRAESDLSALKEQVKVRENDSILATKNINSLEVHLTLLEDKLNRSESDLSTLKEQVKVRENDNISTINNINTLENRLILLEDNLFRILKSSLIYKLKKILKRI